MNILVWNIRKICTSKASLRRIMNKYHLLIVAVLENFLSVKKCAQWAHWLHLLNFNNNGEIGEKDWLFWVDDIEFHLHLAMAQALS